VILVDILFLVFSEGKTKNSPDKGLRSSPQLDTDLVESHIVVNDSSTCDIRQSFIEIGRSRFLANFEVTWLDN